MVVDCIAYATKGRVGSAGAVAPPNFLIMSRPTTDIDLLSAEMQADPHPAFHELRARTPVVWSERHRGWLLTRYDDVSAAFRDARLSADRMTPTFARLDPDTRAQVAVAERHLTRWLVFMDPPDHDGLRRLVSRAFTPTRMEAVRGLVRSLIADLIDGWDQDAPVDFTRTFAWPLPTNVVAGLMGVPSEDYARFAGWNSDVGAVVFGSGSDPARFVRSQRGLEEFDAYLRALAEDVRAGRGRPGLVADLVALHDEGDRLSLDDLIATCTLLLFAGSETTTSLLGNSLAILEHRTGDRERLVHDPSVIPAAVEELMRFESPAKMMVRQAMSDITLPSGTTIAAGDRVFLVVAAANRDPARFKDPDAFIIDRTDNVHVGFGFGIHHCLGAPLARIEAQETLREVYRRFPDVALDATPVWGGGLLGRSASRVRVLPGQPAAAPRG